MNIILEDFTLVRNRKDSVRIKLKSGLCINISKKYFLFHGNKKDKAVCFEPIFNYIVRETKKSNQIKELKFLKSLKESKLSC